MALRVRRRQASKPGENFVQLRCSWQPNRFDPRATGGAWNPPHFGDGSRFVTVRALASLASCRGRNGALLAAPCFCPCVPSTFTTCDSL